MAERYWVVGFWQNGFEGKMLVYGTERDMWEYLNSEIGGGDERHTGNYHYWGASEEDLKAAKQLGMKIYLCPKSIKY